MEIAKNTYLTGSRGDWIVTFNDGHTSKVLGHFWTKGDAIARFGDDHEQPTIRVLVQGHDVGQSVERTGEDGRAVPGIPSEDLRRRYSDVLKTLRERDRRILNYRWGLGGECRHTAGETAGKFGLTPPRIYQIEKAANRQLRYVGTNEGSLNTREPDAPSNPSRELYLRALETVSENERRIFLHRRGLPGGHGHTAEETVRWSGLTPTRISQIVTRVDHKLQSAMTSRVETDGENAHASGGSSDDLYVRILGMLSYQERKILAYRRGLEGGRVHTMAQTVSFFGVTPARIDEISAEAHRMYLNLTSTEATMNQVSRHSDDSAVSNRTPANPRDDAAQPGADIPDEELLALVRGLIEDDDDVKEKVRQYRALQQNAQYVESIGASLLSVPELQALREEWPQYAAQPGSSRKKLSANRIAAIEQTAFFDSLLEWLAVRLWDVSTQPPLSGPSMEAAKTGIPAVVEEERHDSGHDRAGIGIGADQPSGPAAMGTASFAYCNAATTLLDAQFVKDSSYAVVWARLTEKYPEQSRVVIWLQRIEAIQGDTRQETQDELQMQGEIDVLGHDVLAAVDQVLAIDAGPDDHGPSQPQTIQVG